MNTKNVAIIVMLSGLENIPRITELKEIRAQSKPKKPTQSDTAITDTEKGLKIARDDMITLPARKPRDDEAGRKTRAREEPELHDTFIPADEPVIINEGMTAAEAAEFAPESPEPILQTPVKNPVPEYKQEPSGDFIRGAETQVSPKRRVVVMHEETLYASPSIRERHTGHKNAVHRLTQTPEIPATNATGENPPVRETERQRIERELRRQRTVAIGGHPQKAKTPAERSSPTVPEIRIVKRNSHKVQTSEEKGPVESAAPEPWEKRTVIIGKRRISAVPQENPATVENIRPDQTGESASGDSENVIEIRSRVS